jgi:hypothetical protein
VLSRKLSGHTRHTKLISAPALSNDCKGRTVHAVCFRLHGCCRHSHCIGLHDAISGGTIVALYSAVSSWRSYAADHAADVLELTSHEDTLHADINQLLPQPSVLYLRSLLE